MHARYSFLANARAMKLKVLKTTEAARRIGVSNRTLLGWLNSRMIPPPGVMLRTGKNSAYLWAATDIASARKVKFALNLNRKR